MTTTAHSSRLPSTRRASAALPYASAGVLLDNLDVLLVAAGQAASAGDRRPWRFRARRGSLDLRAAPHPGGLGAMAEHVFDREDLISCGAALLNLELAAGHLGLVTHSTLFPDANDHSLLVRVSPVALRTPRADEDELFAAVSRRHTRREPFVRTYVPPSLLDHLAAAAGSEGAALIAVPPGASLSLLDRELLAATARASDDPVSAAGLRARWPAHDGSEPETGHIDILTTAEDSPADWLRAGRALQRLLLTATVRCVAARVFTLALEDPPTRERVRTGLCGGAYPQVVLELGDASQLG